MTRALFFVAAVLLVPAFGCGTHYPHDPVTCQTDADCAADNKCLPLWTHDADAGACLSTSKACLKPCAVDADCSFCGAFTFCAVDACDTSGPKTCSTFCGNGK